MIEKYDVLKAKNLRQMVAEYESEQQTLREKRAEYRQYCRDLMGEVALQELADIRDRELDEAEGAVYSDFIRIRHGYYAPHFWDLIIGYTDHVYDNAWANLQRKYAVVYDKDNLDKYPKPTPLPRMQDIMDQYMPVWVTYEKLKGLAGHCYKWRQH